MGRILLQRLFVRRRGNSVSFFFFLALLDGWTIELIFEIVHVNYNQDNNDEDDEEVKQEEEHGTPSRMKTSKKIFKAKATNKGKTAATAENEEDEVKVEVKPERVDNEDEDDEDENEDGYLF